MEENYLTKVTIMQEFSHDILIFVVVIFVTFIPFDIINRLYGPFSINIIFAVGAFAGMSYKSIVYDRKINKVLKMAEDMKEKL